MIIPYHDDNPTHRFPYVTVAIIVLNVLAALPFVPYYFSEAPTRQMRVIWTEYGFVPRQLTNLESGEPVEIDLYRELGENPSPDPDRTLTLQPSAAHVAMSIVTSMFLHGGPWHLLGNMLFFWIYGNNIEDRIGHGLFVVFYLLGGAAAALCHWAMTGAPDDLSPTIGASGAVATIMGAYIVTYPKAKVHVLFLLGCIPLFFKVPAIIVLAFWIGDQLLSAYWEHQGYVTNVALWAHIGGFAVGAAIMPLLASIIPPPPEDVHWGVQDSERHVIPHLPPPSPDGRDALLGERKQGQWLSEQGLADHGIHWEDDEH